jgi:hypothetical protein
MSFDVEATVEGRFSRADLDGLGPALES